MVFKAEEAGSGLHRPEVAVEALVMCGYMERAEARAEPTRPAGLDALATCLAVRANFLVVIIGCVVLLPHVALAVEELLQAASESDGSAREHRRVVLVRLQGLDPVDLVLAVPIKLELLRVDALCLDFYIV